MNFKLVLTFSFNGKRKPVYFIKQKKNGILRSHHFKITF